MGVGGAIEPRSTDLSCGWSIRRKRRRRRDDSSGKEHSPRDEVVKVEVRGTRRGVM